MTRNRTLRRFHAILVAGLAAAIASCSDGGGGGSTAPANTSPVADNRGETTSDWEQGVFEPAANFRALCAQPRTGIDPATGRFYPDQQGTFVDENNWLRSWSHDLYLWYDEITDRDPAQYGTLEYFGLMKTFERTPSDNPRDRFHFTYSTQEWRELSQSGVSAGYGATWSLVSNMPPRKVVVAYTEPNSPAATSPANLARGAEILTVDGVDVANGTNVDALNGGLFPDDPGETHEFTVQDRDSSDTRTITLESVEVTSDPVQAVQTLDTANGPVGYMLFNDHIAPAEQQLVDAVEQLRDAQIVDLVLDLRYNGGGFLYIANELAFMIAGPNATGGRTFEKLEFNDKHPTFNPVTGRLLEPTPFYSTTADGEPLPGLGLSRLFVLTGPGTCSASESIINGLRGIDIEVIQIGSTTCGKPYGFYPTDNCGTTYFSIQFRGVNDKGFGDYADGFSPVNTAEPEGVAVAGCSVADDFTHVLGDPNEGRLSAALAYRIDQTCPVPSGFGTARSAVSEAPLSAVDGEVRKSPWLTNRILRR